MAGRYVLSDYDKETDEQPRVAYSTNSLEKAEASFKESAERKILSAALYDTKTDEILQIAINGEPIYLVRAIESARELAKEGVDFVVQQGAKAAAGIVIGEVVKSLAGESVPGVGGAVLAHFLAPYYAFKGNAVAAAGAGAGLWGGVSGSLIGGLVGGPVGAVVGGIVGANGAGVAASQTVKAFTEPQKCNKCKGVGLVQDYRRCPECEGYGYYK